MKKVFEISNRDQGAPVQPVLNIRIGYNHLSVAVADQASGALNSLEYYTDEEEVTAEGLREVMDKLPTAGQSFHRVKVVYDYPDASLVPSVLTGQDEAAACRVPPTPGMMVITERIPSWQLYNVFPVPLSVHTLLGNRFPSLHCCHSLTLGMKNMEAVAAHGALWIDITHDAFTVIAARSGQLLLAQNYPYSSPQDLLYYLLAICHEYDLPQNEVETVVTGLVDQESALYRELYQYFGKLRFREAAWDTRSHDYPAHFFTTLNDLMLCVS